jgi:hypothetical protein
MWLEVFWFWKVRTARPAKKRVGRERGLMLDRTIVLLFDDVNIEIGLGIKKC